MADTARAKPTAVILPYHRPMTRPTPGEKLGQILVFTGVTRTRLPEPAKQD